jgi:hypothetical protein
MQVERASSQIPSASALGEKRPDAFGIIRRRRIVDDHAEIWPTIYGKGRIFERDRTEHGVAQMLDAFAMGADVVVAP